MRLKSLGDIRRRDPEEIVFSSLPGEISMTRYAKTKAFKISEMIREVHGGSFEWYGFTLAKKDNPDLITDIGLPANDENVEHYALIGPEGIAQFQETLPGHSIINGWIHSHGSLGLEHFSATDDRNNRTVLDYVTAQLRGVLAKREVLVKDLSLLAGESCSDKDLREGTVTIITDRPVAEVRIFEAVYGGFSYAIVIGDEGWHEGEIHYKHRGILSGDTNVSMRKAELVILDTEMSLTPKDLAELEEQVTRRIRPIKYTVSKLESV